MAPDKHSPASHAAAPESAGLWTEALWARVSSYIAEHLGLHFPRSRRADLLRDLTAAARETDFPDGAHYADWLLRADVSEVHLRTLAGHLTIGETYFFRETKTLDALTLQILPELIRQRRGRHQQLRLWSAACSTGEEPYTLAILLHELLPDWRNWNITLLATDINQSALEKARAAIYGEWSFRAMPAGMRERYFIPQPRGYAVMPEIREQVTFAHLNLAAQAGPSPKPDTSCMDLVLCRNVLIYFAPEQATRLAQKLYDSINEGGWLAVSPSECSQTLFSRFTTVNFPDAILYRKSSQIEKAERRQLAPLSSKPLPPRAVASPPRPRPNDAEHAAATPTTAPAPTHIAVLARELANQGQLSEALTMSEQWAASDKVNQAAHYLHATILREMGERGAARRALERCIYLQPDFALAHFALGTLERSNARHDSATRHFENAQRLLQSRAAEELLPESDGLTVGALSSILTTLLVSHEPHQR